MNAPLDECIGDFFNKYDDVMSAGRIFDGLIACQNGTR
jgi:hypothetical protein